jgi:hypothetical protein
VDGKGLVAEPARDYADWVVGKARVRKISETWRCLEGQHCWGGNGPSNPSMGWRRGVV